jgi:hypothetical protein
MSERDPNLYKLMVEEREQLTAQLPEKIKPMLARLLRERETLSEVALDHIYKMGEAVEDVKEKHRLRSTHPRWSIINWLAEVFGTDPRTLRDYALFARTVPRAKLHMILQPPISWGHVAILLHLGEAAKWECWATKIVAENLTIEELWVAIRGEKMSRPQRAPRRPKPPRDLKQALPRLDKLLSSFLSTISLLFGTEFDIPATVLDTPPDSMNEDLRRQLADMADRMEASAAAASENVQRLRESAERVDQILVRRSQDQPNNIQNRSDRFD